ncbi:putative phosphopantothenoylcysteine decarboxylase [Forsythia ovata]|uniref:phosphopantothenoylcysteine decarboxylase n=1 Tax=Forsythia ovata TaxID=205694 RepID=A0ABD1T611_9LAMI
MESFQVNDASRKPRILLAASGSVAAIKFANLCQCFSQWEVKAVATWASLRFVDLKSLPKNLTLYTDQDEWSAWTKLGHSVLHIELCKWADIMVIAPLSANTLGKIAGGVGNNLLTCIVRAWDYSKPLFVSPSMNTFMWNNPFTKRHLVAIDKLGISLIPPATKKIRPGDYENIKEIAREDYGNGVMGDTNHIFSTITFFFAAWKNSSGGNIQ